MAETIQVTEPSILIPSVGKKIVIISDNLSFIEQLITEYESLYLESNLTFYIFNGKNYDWLLLNLVHVDTIIFDLEFVILFIIFAISITFIFFIFPTIKV